MRPTDVLEEEHRVIEQMLSCLEKMVEKAEREGKLDQKQAVDAVAFFRQFADRCHHAKEEAHLFPLMEEHGFPRHAGPTAVMRSEHEQGRAHVAAMATAAQALGEDPKALSTFTRNARSYAELLHEHIAKENECLFPMANDALAAEEQEALLQRFQEVENEEGARAIHDRCLAIAADMAERLGLKAQALDRQARRFHGGCTR